MNIKKELNNFLDKYIGKEITVYYFESEKFSKKYPSSLEDRFRTYPYTKNDNFTKYWDDIEFKEAKVTVTEWSFDYDYNFLGINLYFNFEGEQYSVFYEL